MGTRSIMKKENIHKEESPEVMEMGKSLAMKVE
jgi:hypothetical protein